MKAIFRNHSKQADFSVAFLSANFANKNAMFNLNENNWIVMAQHPRDMRIGVNSMYGQVHRMGLDPTNDDVYIFVGKSRKIRNCSIGSAAVMRCTTTGLNRAVFIHAFSFDRVSAFVRCAGMSLCC